MGIFHQDIIQLEEAGLYRQLRTISSQKGPRVIVDGKELLVMASNDYLGFCYHPALHQAAQKALHTWGAGSGSSRLISGNTAIFRDLEKKIAQLKGTEDALVFSTGYMANMGLLTAVAEKERCDLQRCAEPRKHYRWLPAQPCAGRNIPSSRY